MEYDEDFDGSGMLINKTPKEIWLSKDQKDLIMIFEEGQCSLKAFGDCCSDSFWADINCANQIIGNKITKVETLRLPTPEGLNKYQEKFYGVNIYTNNGICQMVFRNSSNGYYGGECEFEWSNIIYRVSELGYTQIKKSWSM